MRILGIDPGLTGALALLDYPLGEHRKPVLEVVDMPVGKTLRGHEILEAVLVDTIRQLRPDAAFVEQVASRPKQGVVSTFTFGMGYGMVRGALAAMGIPTTLVLPRVWGRLVQLPVKGTSQARACQLYPDQAAAFARGKDHGRADAALIALAGFRLTSPF